MPPTVLPTFGEMLDHARGHLSEARDWLNSDWATAAGPSAAQADAYHEAMKLIGEAKAAIDRAKR